MRIRCLVGSAAVAACVCTVLLVACGGNDGDEANAPATVDAGDAPVPDAGGPPPVPLPTPLEACRAYIQAYCDRRIECGLPAPGCADVEALCPDYAFATGSTRTVASVAACAKVRRAQPCGELASGFTPDCSPPGTLAAGASCQFVSQCASFNCTALQGNCGTCATPTTDGGCSNDCVTRDCVTCEVNSACVSGRCEPFVARADAGASCSLDAGTCADAAAIATATTIRHAIGETCITKADCAMTAECNDQGICALGVCR